MSVDVYYRHLECSFDLSRICQVGALKPQGLDVKMYQPHFLINLSQPAAHAATYNKQARAPNLLLTSPLRLSAVSEEVYNMSEPVNNAVSSDSLDIPLIDFTAFTSGDEGTTLKTAKTILDGFQNAGFIYLKNHPLSKAVVQRTFAESAKFFHRSLKQKDSLSWTTPEANRGYSGQGREKTSNAFDSDEIAKEREQAGADLKESFEIGREGVEGMPNHWPDQFDQDGKFFKTHMLDFFEQCKDLHVQIMRAIAVGLGIERTWFDCYCDDGDNTLRLLHYPEVAAEVFQRNKSQVRAGAHSDYGSITIVCDSSREVRSFGLTKSALPRHARRASSHVAERELHRRYSDRRYRGCQCGRSARSVVQRHDQEHEASRCRAAYTSRSAPGSLQHRILLQSKLRQSHRCHSVHV